MKKGLLIKEVCELLLADKPKEAEILSTTNYPFQQVLANKRSYSKSQMCQVYLRDGFVDRYSGELLLFPGIFKILTLEFPDIFKYHPNWKISETHPIYWNLMPTIDHIVPVTKGGTNEFDNLVCTSMIRNGAKANWTLEELHWKLHPTGNLQDWDGLSSTFLKLLERKPAYEANSYVKSWKNALLKAQKS